MNSLINHANPYPKHINAPTLYSFGNDFTNALLIPTKGRAKLMNAIAKEFKIDRNQVYAHGDRVCILLHETSAIYLTSIVTTD